MLVDQQGNMQSAKATNNDNTNSDLINNPNNLNFNKDAKKLTNIPKKSG